MPTIKKDAAAFAKKYVRDLEDRNRELQDCNEVLEKRVAQYQLELADANRKIDMWKKNYEDIFNELSRRKRDAV